MTTWLLPIAATFAAAALTYWCCVRPMRKGQHGPAPATRGCCTPPATPTDLDTQIKQARTELYELRDNAGTGRTP